MTSAIPTFGEKRPVATYIVRTGAYAVIFDGENRVAALRGMNGYFLPGGGVENTETLEASLHRELFEECGATVEVLEAVGEATDFIYSKNEETYFEKRGTFYLARFTSVPVSKELEWLVPDQVKRVFRQDGHAWAVMRALDQKGVKTKGTVRRYKTGDHIFICRIFHNAVHELACRDYTREQLDAWASPSADIGQREDHWKQRCERKMPFVKEIGGAVVGFIELDPDGHIDCTYVDPAHAGTGVMWEIMAEVKREARLKGNKRLFAEVSKTARPLFERNGFTWVRDNVVTIRGVMLVNYIMECRLPSEAVEQ